MYLTYADVPKEYGRNLLWRKFIWNKLTNGSPADKHVIIESCRRDVLFYVNSFVWTNDPRKKESCLPFITYEYQDRFLLKLRRNYERSQEEGTHQDILVLKGRTLGATWCVLVFLDHCTRFESDKQHLAISRTEQEVDSKDNPAVLFAKMDFIEKRLPSALQIPGRIHTHLKIVNPINRTVLEGESSNPNAGRSGRYATAFRDEEAFQDNGARISDSLDEGTLMQIRVSTPNGIGGSYHATWKLGKIDIFIMHWSEHPEKNPGLYSIEGGKVNILDEEWHRQNPGYEFCFEPTQADPGVPWEFLRSPWFDEIYRKAEDLKRIAQEHQLSFLGSGNPYFSAVKLNLAKDLNVRDPLYKGDYEDFINVDLADTDTRPDRFKLWCELDAQGRPPQNTTYSIGVDVSAGSGASDSSINVIDDITKVKVCEFYTNGITPEPFAQVLIDVCKFFSTPKSLAFLGWDMGGHGIPLGIAVLKLGYDYVFYYGMDSDTEMSKDKKPGMPSNKNIKLIHFGKYRKALFSGDYISRSKATYLQASEFVFDGVGGVKHKKSKTTDNLSDKGEQHGDIVTGEVIMWHVSECRPEPRVVEPEIPENCHRARYNRRMAKREEMEGVMPWRR